MDEEEEETNSLWALIKNLTANMETALVLFHPIANLKKRG